jgi:hypothetical protein
MSRLFSPGKFDILFTFQILSTKFEDLKIFHLSLDPVQILIPEAVTENNVTLYCILVKIGRGKFW